MASAGLIERDKGRGNAARKIRLTLVACLMGLAADTAHANDRLVKTKKPIIACSSRQVMLDYYRLIQSDDRAASDSYYKKMIRSDICAYIHPGEDIYVGQMDVLDKTIQSGLQEGMASVLSEALGFKIPTQVPLVRIRKAGDTVWRYTFLRLVL